MKHGHRFLVGGLVVVALAVALVLIAAGGQGALAAPSIIYVDADATGGNNGSSWDDAYTDLQPALSAAASGDEIWVAAGTYKPTSGTDRSASFQMVNGVEIYGGFDPDAGATKFRDRDWATYAALLSGDIGIEGDPSDNSWRVFYHPEELNLDGSAVLDGFTITGGYMPSGGGSGMYNSLSSPTVSNCTFSGNSAQYGGGMVNQGSAPVLTNCTFEGNSGGGMANYYSSPTVSNCTFQGNSVTENGGGMANYNSSPMVSNCTFSGNSADYGGGMYNFASSPVVTNCTFQGNSVTENGGGMSNHIGTAPTLTDCSFSDNSADNGGGMYNSHDSSPTLTNCTLSGNSALERGGGMYNTDDSLATLTNCTFDGNSAGYSGGGIYNTSYSAPTLTNCTFSGNSASISGGGMCSGSYASPILTNCTFDGNSAGGSGGGMGNWTYSAPTLTNCTFSGNSASTSGGGMYSDYNASPILTNSILWANTPDEIFHYGAVSVITYSNVQGGYVGTGNIDADPWFVDPENGDFHLGAGSLCIDAGDNTAPNLPAYDFEGDDRILDGDGNGSAIVDMGVDEYIVLTISVEIDITPNTPSNMIKLGSGADVPVAVLTTDDFEAADVDPLTVLFAGAEPEAWVWVNVDGDGDDDLLLYFDPRNLDLDESDRQATLTGLTYDGVLIEGTDRVKVKE